MNIIRSEISSVAPRGTAYLFGSRADDSGKRGDIDIFLKAAKCISLERPLLLEARVSGPCGTKVDMLVKSPEDAELPINRIAKRGVRL